MLRPVRPLLAALILFTSTVSLQARADESEGERLFKEGVTLLETAERTKDPAAFDQACDRFARSYAAEQLLNPLLNLARCEEGRGHLGAAHRTWIGAADLAAKQGDASAQVLAQNAAKSIADKLPKLVVQVPERARAAELSIDGNLVLVGEATPVDPGPHKVRARLASEVDEKEVRVEQGQVVVDLFAAKAVGEGPKPTPSKGGGSGLAIPGWVLLGVGGATWIGTVATSALYMSNCDEPFTCPENAFGGGGLAEANLALWIAAPVISGVGATLLIVDAASGSSDDGAPPAVTVGARAWSNGSGASVGVVGSF